MSAGTKRSNADEDNNDETPTNANTGILISEPVKKGPIKGQIISKCLFGIFNSPKKRTIKFNSTTMAP